VGVLGETFAQEPAKACFVLNHQDLHGSSFLAIGAKYPPPCIG
jgi:hypothetical protein